MIILHAAAIVWGEIGGPNVSVPNLVSAQNRLDGVEAALAITVANRCDSNATSPPETDFPLFDFNVGAWEREEADDSAPVKFFPFLWRTQELRI